VWRWVQRYAPELQRRLRRHLKPTDDSWRVDETYIRVKGRWVYLYLTRGAGWFSPPKALASAKAKPVGVCRRRGAFYSIASFSICSARWRSNFADAIAKLRLNSKLATLPGGMNTVSSLKNKFEEMTSSRER
jgi:hypothetical protein